MSRDRAVMDLLRMEQGGRSFMEFISEVEEQEKLCRISEMPLTSDDLRRIALIAGMNDRTLAEKAMAEEYNLEKVITTGLSRETSRANAEAMQSKPTARVNRLPEAESDSDIDVQNRLDILQEEIADIRRLKKAGKYSTRYAKEK